MTLFQYMARTEIYPKPCDDASTRMYAKKYSNLQIQDAIHKFSDPRFGFNKAKLRLPNKFCCCCINFFL